MAEIVKVVSQSCRGDQQCWMALHHLEWPKIDDLVVLKNFLKSIFDSQANSGMRHSTTGIMQGVKNRVNKLPSKFKAGKELVKLI